MARQQKMTAVLQTPLAVSSSADLASQFAAKTTGVDRKKSRVRILYSPIQWTDRRMDVLFSKYLQEKENLFATWTTTTIIIGYNNYRYNGRLPEKACPSMLAIYNIQTK